VQTSFSLPFDPAQAVAVVQEAALLSLSFRGKFSPDVKADNTLVTEADRQIELFLRERLGALAPGWSFLGEEGGLVGDADAPCWVIDPIDGTTNFVRGLPLWCISVGAVYQGRAIFGCIAVPPQNEMLWAATGHGAWLQLESSTQSPPPAIALRVFDSDVLMQEDLIACNTTVESAVNFAGVPCRLRNLGTLAYHLVALSRGALVASIARQHQLYDIAAGVCICEEAGCIARYLDGTHWQAEIKSQRELRPLIVAPPQIMAQLLAGLQKN
jgi:myo-inositol-1(or 4)-monophosphatase